jgi:hypothetical protein
VNSIALDPTTDFAYIFAGSGIYETDGGSTATKLKTLSLNASTFYLTQLISAYNKNYVIGLPIDVNASKPYEGFFYAGVGM